MQVVQTYFPGVTDRYFGKCKKSPSGVKVDKTKYLVITKINSGKHRLMTKIYERIYFPLMMVLKKISTNNCSCQPNFHEASLFLIQLSRASWATLTRNPPMLLKMLHTNSEKWGL